MKTVAETFEIARSSLIERLDNAEHKSRGTYMKADDQRLVPLVLELIGERPAYGYRRITARLNRRLRKAGEPVSTTSVFSGSCVGRGCCCKSAPVSGSIVLTMAWCKRFDRTRAGVRTVSRFAVGTQRSFASPSRSIRAIGKPSLGAGTEVSPAKSFATSCCWRSSVALRLQGSACDRMLTDNGSNYRAKKRARSLNSLPFAHASPPSAVPNRTACRGVRKDVQA